MCHGHGVVLGTDLEHHGHVAGVVEVDKGVHCAGELAVYGLVCDLKGADVLEALHGDAFAVCLLLVESHGLVDALDDESGKDNYRDAKNYLEDDLY